MHIYNYSNEKVSQVSDFLQNYMKINNIIKLTPNDCAPLLNSAGLLSNKPGPALAFNFREMLRQGRDGIIQLVAGAHQIAPRKRWTIYKIDGYFSDELSDSQVRNSSLKKDEQNISKDNQIKILIDLENSLLEKKYYRTVASIKSEVPVSPGIYSIRADGPNIPSIIREELHFRKSNLLYVGVATISLKKRLLDQELGAKGHGTFFRSIGSVLGYKPEKGSFRSKKNKRNFIFKRKDISEIINWINYNLIINFVEYDGDDLKNVETEIIKKYSPLFNISKTPNKFYYLVKLRENCIKIANSI